MSTIRVQKNKENPYVMLNKTALEDESLSWKAKGIFAYLMSKPDTWKCQVTDLRKKAKDGTDSIKAGLRELRENGYMIKRPIKNDKGVIIEWEEILYETPQEVAKEVFQDQEVKRIASLEKRRAKSNNSTNGKSTNGKPTSGKPNCIVNNNIQNTDVININTSSSNKKNGIFDYFENNICKLKKTTFNKFADIVEQYDHEFIKAIIEECTLTNVTSYKGFESALNIYLNSNCISAKDVHKHAENYYKKKQVKKLNKSNSTSNEPKKLRFTDYEQRDYDFDDLEKKLLGWSND